MRSLGIEGNFVGNGRCSLDNCIILGEKISQSQPLTSFETRSFEMTGTMRSKWDWPCIRNDRRLIGFV